jgi:hypothetical protein
MGLAEAHRTLPGSKSNHARKTEEETRDCRPGGPPFSLDSAWVNA